MWYFEIYEHLLGDWVSQARADKPPTITVAGVLRLKRPDGRRPNIRSIQEVNADHLSWSLDELRSIYGAQKAEQPPTSSTWAYTALVEKAEKHIAFCDNEASYLASSESDSDPAGAAYARLMQDMAETMKALVLIAKGGVL